MWISATSLLPKDENEPTITEMKRGISDSDFGMGVCSAASGLFLTQKPKFLHRTLNPVVVAPHTAPVHKNQSDHNQHARSAVARLRRGRVVVSAPSIQHACSTASQPVVLHPANNISTTANNISHPANNISQGHDKHDIAAEHAVVVPSKGARWERVRREYFQVLRDLRDLGQFVAPPSAHSLTFSRRTQICTARAPLGGHLAHCGQGQLLTRRRTEPRTHRGKPRNPSHQSAQPFPSVIFW